MAARAAAEAAEAEAAAEEEEEGDGEEPGGRFAAAAAAGDAGSGWDTGLLPSPVGGSKNLQSILILPILFFLLLLELLHS